MINRKGCANNRPSGDVAQKESNMDKEKIIRYILDLMGGASPEKLRRFLICAMNILK